MIGKILVSNSKLQVPSSFFNRGRRTKDKGQTGFSLLELVIAMFVLVILISVAVPTYQRTIKQARETVLKENLWQMRRMIDQYAADKGRLPGSLDDLKESGYLSEIPTDPITEEAEWEQEQGEDINSPDGEQGLVNVRSRADGEDSEGKKYSEY